MKFQIANLGKAGYIQPDISVTAHTAAPGKVFTGEAV